MNSSSNPVNEKSIYLTSQIKTFSNKLYILQIHEYILLIDAFDIYKYHKCQSHRNETFKNINKMECFVTRQAN
jgi:hypothetical protein